MMSNNNIKRVFLFFLGGLTILLFGCSQRSNSSHNGGETPKVSKPADQGKNNSKAGPPSLNGVSPNSTAATTALGIGAAAGARSAANFSNVPNDVPPATAINTKGARLLIGYLRGAYTGEAVVDKVFETNSEVPFRLGEIKAAILKLHQADRLTKEDEDKIEVLDADLNKRLVETIQFHDRLDKMLKYGTAIAVGGVSFVYAPEIVGAGKTVLQSSVVRTPWNYVVRGYESMSGWVSRRFSRAAADAGVQAAERATETAAAESTAQAAERAAGPSVGPTVGPTVGPSVGPTVGDMPTGPETAGTHADNLAQAAEEMQAGAGTAQTSVEGGAAADQAAGTAGAAARAPFYRRVVNTVRFGSKMPTDEFVFRATAKALSDPALAQGFEVVQVPADQMATVQALKYSRTGIPDFAINQRAGDAYFTARRLTANGYEYRYVLGRAIETLTEKGQKVIITDRGVVGIAAARMKGWGRDSADFVSNRSKQVKDWASGTRVWQTLNSEAGRKYIQKTAVGTSAGLLTLWAVNPIDTKSVTVNDYLLALSKQGININDFPDQLREELQNEANVPKVISKSTSY